MRNLLIKCSKIVLAKLLVKMYVVCWFEGTKSRPSIPDSIFSSINWWTTSIYFAQTCWTWLRANKEGNIRLRMCQSKSTFVSTSVIFLCTVDGCVPFLSDFHLGHGILISHSWSSCFLTKDIVLQRSKVFDFKLCWQISH